MTAVVTPLYVSQHYVHYGFTYICKQALEIPPDIFTESIFTDREHNTLLQLNISAEKQVDSSTVSFQT